MTFPRLCISQTKFAWKTSHILQSLQRYGSKLPIPFLNIVLLNAILLRKNEFQHYRESRWSEPLAVAIHEWPILWNKWLFKITNGRMYCRARMWWVVWIISLAVCRCELSTLIAALYFVNAHDQVGVVVMDGSQT